MTIGGFPGSKLLLQVFRQFTKPLSTSIINFAKSHPSFRRYLLVKPGQYYHWCDTMTKLYLGSDKLNYTSEAKIVRPREIKESIAMEVGAQLMLEAMVFLILAAFVVYDSNKSASRAQMLEDSKDRDFEAMVERKDELSRRIEDQAALIRDLRSRLDIYGYSLPEDS